MIYIVQKTEMPNGQPKPWNKRTKE